MASCRATISHYERRIDGNLRQLLIHCYPLLLSLQPYLGVCLGFQVMVMEYARNVLGMTGANSTEFDEKCENPVVVFMPEIDKVRVAR